MEALTRCHIVTVDYSSYTEQLWRNTRLFCSPKTVLQSWDWASLSACSPVALCFLALPLQAGRQALPSQGKCSSWGVPVLCASMRNWQSHKIVPVPLGFCSSPKMFPLLLICCKVPPQPLRLPASISAGFVLSKNIMLQFSLQGNGAGDACLPLGEEDMYKMYSCLWNLNCRSCQTANCDYIFKGGLKVFVHVLYLMELFLEDSALWV